MIAENIEKIRSEIPDGVRLIAVSKLKPVEDIQEAYAAGQRLFGENYATELRDKAAVLPKDIEWHFIGHLQGKQLKYYIPFVSMIHGVDSIEHLEEVEKAAAKVNRTVDVLLQVHVAQEETKFGFSPEELEKFQFSISNFQFVRICGLMAMASNTTDRSRVRADFREAKRIFDSLKVGVFKDNDAFVELSMGMSHDWQIAVEEGSTLIRLGTSIFGPRDYNKTKI
jgi:pyridoxal phosphate enzyme (YggS family)